MLRLHLLGASLLERDDGRHIQLQRRPFALLALIAIAGRGGISRGKVLGLLWPDTDEERARHALAQALYALRRPFGTDVVTGTDTLRLECTEVASDLADFEAAIAAEEPERAATLYGGPLMDSFTLPNAGEFERHIERERARLAHRAARALESSATRAAERGDARECADWWRRLATLEPLDSRVAVALMEALARAGESSAALRHAELFQRLRRMELELPPEPGVTAAAARLRSAPHEITGAVPDPVSRAPAASGVPASTAPVGAEGSDDDTGGVQTATPTPPPAPDMARSYRGHPLLWAGILTAVAIVAGVGGVLLRPARPLDTRRVVVTVFQNRTADTTLASLGDMAADWVGGELARTGLVDVVDSRAVIVNSLRSDAGKPPEASAARMRDVAREVGAGIMVWGAYYRRGDTLEFDSQLTDVRDGSVLRDIPPIVVSAHNPMYGLQRLSSRVMGALATVESPGLAALAGRGGSPPTYEAYREFVDGIEADVRQRTAEALAHYQRAAALDSTFLQPLLFAADAERTMGRPEQSESTLARLSVHRDRLAPANRLYLDLQLAQIHGQPEEAYEAARRMGRLSPTSESFAIAGQTALVTGRPREALQWLERVNVNERWVQEWSEYWFESVMAAHLSGNDDEALRLGRRARQLYPDELVGYGSVAIPLVGLGETAAVEAELDSAANAPAGDGWRYDELLNTIASELAVHGHPNEAHRVWTKALRWYATHPNDSTLSPDMHDMEDRVLVRAGHPQEGLRAARAFAGVHPENPAYLATLGTAEVAAGDSAAGRATDEHLAQMEAIVHPAGAVTRGIWALARARVTSALGDRATAVTELRKAVAGGAVWEYVLHRSHDFQSLRSYPPFEELAKPRG